MDHPRPRRKLSIKKRLAYSLLVMTFAGCAILLVGELVFRVRRIALSQRIADSLGESETEAGWAIFDSDLHYRNRPNWQDHNEHGMRDRPLGEKNGFRILLLGDSLGYQGDSIDDTYPSQVEAIVNRDATLEPCEILNASTKGYTNYQELEYLKKFGVALDIDAVGVAFCVNDLHRFLHQFDVIDGEIVASTYALTPNAATVSAPRFLAPSLFCSWLWHKGAAATTMIGIRRGTVFECRPDICTAWKEERWPELEAQMEEMAALCKQRDLPLFLIAFPHAEQYRPEYLEEDRDYVLKPQKKLKQICARLAIPFLDLYPSLDKSDFKWDGIHLTSEGRTVAAQQIAEFLATQRLIPPKMEE